jgi:hypothetical protein
MIRSITWGAIFVGSVVAVIGALALAYFEKVFNQGRTVQQAIVESQLGIACGSAACGALPNLNRTPQNPASAYQGGAPVHNFFTTRRAGRLVAKARQ